MGAILVWSMGAVVSILAAWLDRGHGPVASEVTLLNQLRMFGRREVLMLLGLASLFNLGVAAT